MTENVLFYDEIDSINKESRNLRKQGVNIIIVLSHCGYVKDLEIAKQCDDVDIIVGGHSHTLMHNGVYI